MSAYVVKIFYTTEGKEAWNDARFLDMTHRRMPPSHFFAGSLLQAKLSAVSECPIGSRLNHGVG